MIRLVDHLEDYSRKNNIRIDGFVELPNETNETLHVKVTKLIQDKLQIKDVKIDNIHRLSGNKKDQSTPRTIITRFSNQFHRDSTIKNKMKLKGTGIFINEDLCENTIKARREKMDQFKQAKSSGKIAFFNGKNLVVRERRHNPAENNLQPSNTPTKAVSELIEAFTPTPKDTNIGPQVQPSPALNDRLRSSQS